MFFIKSSNLQQAFEMSVYTWAAALLLGIGVWLVTTYVLKTSERRVKMVTVVAIITGVYTAITSTMWFYYFNVMLCLPFFALLLFVTWQLWKLDRKTLGAKIALGLVIITAFIYLLAGWFFGMLF